MRTQLRAWKVRMLDVYSRLPAGAFARIDCTDGSAGGADAAGECLGPSHDPHVGSLADARVVLLPLAVREVVQMNVVLQLASWGCRQGKRVVKIERMPLR